MKTRIFKIGMPFMVFMMAIAFAFASENDTKENETMALPGYIFRNGVCEPSINCDNNGGPLCKDDDGFTVYAPSIDGTFCTVPMTQWQ
jgi:hypothetical protein